MIDRLRLGWQAGVGRCWWRPQAGLAGWRVGQKGEREVEQRPARDVERREAKVNGCQLFASGTPPDPG